jgi:hypothetical protein
MKLCSLVTRNSVKTALEELAAAAQAAIHDASFTPRGLDEMQKSPHKIQNREDQRKEAGPRHIIIDRIGSK